MKIVACRIAPICNEEEVLEPRDGTVLLEFGGGAPSLWGTEFHGPARGFTLTSASDPKIERAGDERHAISPKPLQ